MNLKKINETIEYTLQIVPKFYNDNDEVTPILSLTKEVMKFLVDIDADYEIDYYVFNNDYYWAAKVYYQIKVND